MARSNGTPNVYTSKIPTGTLNRVQLTQPNNVKIVIPNRSGNNLPTTKAGNNFLRKLFG
jgi:hypothetical protein